MRSVVLAPWALPVLPDPPMPAFAGPGIAGWTALRSSSWGVLALVEHSGAADVGSWRETLTGRALGAVMAPESVPVPAPSPTRSVRRRRRLHALRMHNRRAAVVLAARALRDRGGFPAGASSLFLPLGVGAVLAQDGFPQPAGTEMNGKAAAVGGPWTVPLGNGWMDVNAPPGAARINPGVSTVTGSCAPALGPGASYVSGEIVEASGSGTGNNRAGVVLLHQGAVGLTGYTFFYAGTVDFRLYRDGAASLGTWAAARVVGDTMRLEHDGAGNFTAFVNGIIRIGPVADATYTTGPGGLYSEEHNDALGVFEAGGDDPPLTPSARGHYHLAGPHGLTLRHGLGVPA